MEVSRSIVNEYHQNEIMLERIVRSTRNRQTTSQPLGSKLKLILPNDSTPLKSIFPTGSKLKSMKGIKETLLVPRFYTTDFDEMEQLFNTEMNKNLNEAEFEALLQEFKTDYNQTHFVRNKEFKEVADGIQGPMRQIFVEFLERSCTAEFSGFLLYKELGRRLKDTEREFVTTPNQRSEIEETLVDLESYGVGNEAIDLEKLDRTWRLQYTSASDVLVLLDSPSPSE
ncbi:hypothetical protein LXL04_039370 [Taraxacum kok-saghyz]